jgi:hypothetical protein
MSDREVGGGFVDPNAKFVVKDSGKRKEFSSGMKRDLSEGKTDYSLCFDGPMFRRWAEHLTKGAVKYGKHNWECSTSFEELDRFRESAIRHFAQWVYGEVDEDHVAAVFYNLNAFEYLVAKMQTQNHWKRETVLEGLEQYHNMMSKERANADRGDSAHPATG